MNALKNALISTPDLTLPNTTGHMTLETEARDDLMGCVLLQQQPNGTTTPIEYWSQSLTDADCKYDTTQRECLAIVWAVLLQCPFLKCSRSTIGTNHDFLNRILDLTDNTGKLARWRLQLFQSYFIFIRRAGVKHQAADALSRS